MSDSLRQYRLYILMFVLNVAVLVGVIYLLRRDEPHTITITTPVPAAATPVLFVTVELSGAVAQPGIYKLSYAAHVSDALTIAGGAASDADLSAINLARQVTDGEKIDVPRRPSGTVTITNAKSLAPISTAQPRGAKLNLNTATLEDLIALPHIGAVLAKRIIDYRTVNGPFKQAEDLINVSGIGTSLYDDIKDLITVE